MEISTRISVLKWVIIIWNGLGLIMNILVLIQLLARTKSDSLPDWLPFISFLPFIALEIVAILAAHKENPVWLKIVVCFYLAIDGIILLATGLAWLMIDKEAMMKKCLKDILKNSAWQLLLGLILDLLLPFS